MSNFVPKAPTSPAAQSFTTYMSKVSRFFLVTAHSHTVDLGLYILRVGTSLLMIPHGWSKLQKLNDKPVDFYNFLGLGPEMSLLLIVIAEFFCSIALILGIGTRAILIPLMIGMAVVAFMVHGADPFSEKEHAFLFLIPYIVLFITGPGKYSLDYFFMGKQMKTAEEMAKRYF